MRVRAAVSLATLAVVAPSCRGRASAAECAAIADHYVDLAARETPGATALTAGQLAAVRDVERGLKRAEPAFRRVQDHCEDVAKAESASRKKGTFTRRIICP